MCNRHGNDANHPCQQYTLVLFIKRQQIRRNEKNILTQGYFSVSLLQEMPVLVLDLVQISTLLVNTVPDFFFFSPEP
jgi:hypothetical protein